MVCQIEANTAPLYDSIHSHSSAAYYLRLRLIIFVHSTVATFDLLHSSNTDKVCMHEIWNESLKDGISYLLTYLTLNYDL